MQVDEHREIENSWSATVSISRASAWSEVLPIRNSPTSAMFEFLIVSRRLARSDVTSHKLLRVFDRGPGDIRKGVGGDQPRAAGGGGAATRTRRSLTEEQGR